MSGDRLADQEAIYGTTLATRFGSVMRIYGLSQRALSDVLGLSAPMLSQLIHGQRTKIGNPAVYERLVMLESRAAEPDRARVLEEVRQSNPVLTGQLSTSQATSSSISSLASPEQLRAVAQYARSIGADRLADALEGR